MIFSESGFHWFRRGVTLVLIVTCNLILLGALWDAKRFAQCHNGRHVDRQGFGLASHNPQSGRLGNVMALPLPVSTLTQNSAALWQRSAPETPARRPSYRHR